MNTRKIHRRPDLWYGKYDQCLRIWLHEASCLRDISGGEKRIRYIIQRKRDWGRRMVTNLGTKQPGSWLWNNLEITEQDESNLISMLDFLQSARVDYRKSISSNYMYFYTSDAVFLDSIEALPFLERREQMQRGHIQLEGTPGTVRLQETNHRYRSYFRGYMRLSDQQEIALQRYISNLADARLSPALRDWVQSRQYRSVGDYFFIDHDDMGIVTMLSLIIPGIIRRTKPIETTK